jgi:RND family efflux transporter MFP subunit
MSDCVFLSRPRTWLLALALLVPGCGPHAAAPEPVAVTVAAPVERPITDALEFTGRTEAVDSVQLRARVSGYVQKVNFKDGDEVTKDQVLFEIDDRTFKAAREQATADVNLYAAQVGQAEAEYRRDEKLRATGAATLEETEKAMQSRDSAAAAMDAAKAELAQQELNLKYSQVKAPISGRADRANVTVGNLVTANSSTATLLTTIVTLQPIYVTFSVDEPTLLRLRQMVAEGKVKPAAEKAPEVFFGVGRGDDYPFRATVDYISSQIQGSTGTLPVRAVCPNKDEFVRPGLFARVRVPVGDPHPALLVKEQALLTNQGQQYVHVVNDQNEVVYRPVTVGPPDGGLRVITSGLKAGERIIIENPSQVRPGAVVDPKPGQMEAAPAKDKAGDKPAPGAE